jgi:tryptophan synthase alpha chain
MSRINHAFLKKAKIAYLTAGHIPCHFGKEKSVARVTAQTNNQIATLLCNASHINEILVVPKQATIDQSVEYFLALTNAGVNILEIGLPFSDPVADGPVIQLAMQQALNDGINFAATLEIIAKVRAKTEAAIIVFTYFNPLSRNLEDKLIKLKQAGSDGVLVVDLPLEENDKLRFLCDKLDLAPIMVAAPSTSLPRVQLLSNSGSGFLYYACRKGTTGVRDELPDNIIDQIRQVKNASKLPVAVGFGVSNATMVNKLLDVADGCVIGSYFVNAITNGKTPSELETMTKEVFKC